MRTYDYTYILNAIEKRYNINADGRITSKKRNTKIKLHKNNKGYLYARLYVPEIAGDKKKRNFRLHRLLVMKYLDSFDERLQVNHINGIKTDNRICNLEMVTCSENIKHGWDLCDKKARLSKLRWGADGRFVSKSCFEEIE